MIFQLELQHMYNFNTLLYKIFKELNCAQINIIEPYKNTVQYCSPTIIYLYPSQRWKGQSALHTKQIFR